MCSISTVSSFDTKIAHPNIANLAAKLYNENSTRKLTDEEIQWIAQGAEEEDMPTRWFNHFYDPIHDKGIWFGKQFLSAQAWSNNSFEQSNFSLGDQSWNRAKYNFQHDKRKEAFIALGHTLHLIADMAVPAHTRLDSHPSGDSFEQYVKNNWSEIEKQIYGKAKIKKVYNLSSVFDVLAGFSNGYFYSDDSIFDSNYDNPNFDQLIIKNENIAGKDYKFMFATNFLNNKLCRDKSIGGWQNNFSNLSSADICVVNDQFVLSSYANLLIPQAIGYSAGVIQLFFTESSGKSVSASDLSGMQKSGLGFANELLGSAVAWGIDTIDSAKGESVDDLNSGSPAQTLPQKSVVVTVPKKTTLPILSTAPISQKTAIVPIPSISNPTSTYSYRGGSSNSPLVPVKNIIFTSPPSQENNTSTPTSTTSNTSTLPTTTSEIELPSSPSSTPTSTSPTPTSTPDTSTTTPEIVSTTTPELIPTSTSEIIPTTTPEISITTPNPTSTSTPDDITTTTPEIIISTTTPSTPTTTPTSTPETSTSTITTTTLSTTPSGFSGAGTGEVVINEIAWAGTAADWSQDEWIELYNNTDTDITLASNGTAPRWKIMFDNREAEPDKISDPVIPAHGYYLMERGFDDTIKVIPANTTFSLLYGIKNSGAKVQLIKPDGTLSDEVDCSNGWFAGDNTLYHTMERLDTTKSGNDPTNWQTNHGPRSDPRTRSGGQIFGSPKASNFGNIALNTTQLSGTVVTLTKEDSPYVLGGYDVKAGAVLNIDPGVIVKSNYDGAALIVEGALNIRGTSDEPVRFTSGRDIADGQLVDEKLPDGSPAMGDWQGMWFWPGSVGNIDYLDMQYAGHKYYPRHDLYAESKSEGIRSDSASLTINNSYFMHDGETFVRSVDNSNLSISNSVFSDGGVAIFHSGFATPTLSNNTYEDFTDPDPVRVIIVQ